MNLLNNPAFLAYTFACLALCANLAFLWVYSGVARGKSKTALNAEDAAAFNAALVEANPPKVARILRAHENAQAAIYPFLFLGLVFVLAGGGGLVAGIVFSIFTVARYLHTLAYLKMLQPLRTGTFLVGALCSMALLVAIGWRAIGAL